MMATLLESRVTVIEQQIDAQDAALQHVATSLQALGKALNVTLPPPPPSIPARMSSTDRERRSCARSESGTVCDEAAKGPGLEALEGHMRATPLTGPPLHRAGWKSGRTGSVRFAGSGQFRGGRRRSSNASPPEAATTIQAGWRGHMGRANSTGLGDVGSSPR